MILEFTEISICNLFSYYSGADTEPESIHLGGAEPGARNIAIIQGRNGQGKTSFLNSLRLLFLDLERAKQEVAGRALRNTGIQQLATRDFILGLGSEWMGVLNRLAVRERQAAFYVKASWRESGGIASAMRTWTADGESTLLFWPPGRPTSPAQNADAQKALGERLPPEFVRFYFFDGDTLQDLAEALVQVGSGEAIAQLLGTNRLGLLAGVLEDLERSLPRRARLGSRIDTVRDAAYEVERWREEIVAFETRLEMLAGEVSQTSSRLERTRYKREQQGRDGWIGADERERLALELKTRQAGLDHRSQTIQRELIPALVLYTAPELVEAGIKRLEAAQASGHAVRQEDWDNLAAALQRLPVEPPGPRPALTEGQKEYLGRKISVILEDFKPAFLPSAPSEALHLLPDDIGNLLSRLHEVKASGHTGMILREVAKERAAIAQLEDTLNNSTSISDDRRQTFESLLSLEKRLESELAAQRGEMKARQQEIPQLRKVLSEKEARLREASVAVEEARELRRQLEVVKRLSRFVEGYQELVQRLLAPDLSRRITEHWKRLMTSNTLIDQVKLDDRFVVTLQTFEETEWSPSAISAGMRQILATAVIWALADYDGNRAPVVIDTPLGRLDQEHQRQLASHYYPKAAAQVILLPTDSEVNEFKLRKWYGASEIPVYRRFQLHTDRGQDTRVQEVGKLAGGER